MDSNKTNTKSRAAILPQRRNGKARVAAVLAAGAAVIAERGYDAATMAEIAARAGAPIGSLYRFFPNKEVLADALIQRYAALVKQFFDALDRRAASEPLESLADAFLDFKIQLHDETQTMLGLLEARSDWSSRRREFRTMALKRVSQTLRCRVPTLPSREALDMAVMLLQNMKTMGAFKFDPKLGASAGAIQELRHMNRLYLASRLGKRR